MQVYLYPNYVSLDSIEGESTPLFQLCGQQGVDLEERNWGGTLESLPKQPAIVRMSSMMKCGEREFARKCAELGHFAFYYDAVILPDGTRSRSEFITKLEEWLTTYGDQKMDRNLVIPYLRSESKDTSTLGSGDHRKRKAKMMLKLWSEHVIDASVTPSSAFSSLYPVVKLGADEESKDMLQQMGFDFKTVKAIQEQIAADVKAVEGLPGNHPDVQSLYQKLRVGLEHNTEALDFATKSTAHHYAIGDVLSGLGNIGGEAGLELFLGTFRSRHNTDGGGAGVSMFMRAMLPILIEKLTMLGYPAGKDEDIEWDYNEPPKAHGMQSLSTVGPYLGVTVSHGIETPTPVKCAACGHEIKIAVYQEMEPDGKTPKGQPEVRNLPEACPNCSAPLRKQ